MISLDSINPETYGRIRVGSDYERVRENILTFLRLRREMKSSLPLIRLSFCVTSLNEKELDEFVETWAPLVDFFSIQQFGNIFFGRRAEEGARLFPRRLRYQPDRHPRCAQPWKRVLVRHNGDVAPCCDVSGLPLVLGNIHEQSLKDIWLGPDAERLRTLQAEGRYQEISVCRDCMTKWGPPPEAGS